MVRVLSVEIPVLPSASAIAAASPDTSLTVITCPTASVAPETASTTRVVDCVNAPFYPPIVGYYTSNTNHIVQSVPTSIWDIYG